MFVVFKVYLSHQRLRMPFFRIYPEGLGWHHFSVTNQQSLLCLLSFFKIICGLRIICDLVYFRTYCILMPNAMRSIRRCQLHWHLLRFWLTKLRFGYYLQKILSLHFFHNTSLLYHQPFNVARCKAVHPSLSATLTSAPFLINDAVILSRPIEVMDFFFIVIICFDIETLGITLFDWGLKWCATKVIAMIDVGSIFQ